MTAKYFRILSKKHTFIIESATEVFLVRPPQFNTTSSRPIIHMLYKYGCMT